MHCQNQVQSDTYLELTITQFALNAFAIHIVKMAAIYRKSLEYLVSAHLHDGNEISMAIAMFSGLSYTT